MRVTKTLIILQTLFLVTTIECTVRADSTVFHVYAPSRTTKELLVLSAGERESKLILKQDSATSLGFPAVAITRHPRQPLLFLANARKEDGKAMGAVVRLKPDGSIKNVVPVELHTGYCFLSVDRTGKYLLGASYGEGFVDVYKIDSLKNSLKLVTVVDPGQNTSHCVLPTPDNKFVYIPFVKQNNAIYQYRFTPESGGLIKLNPLNANPPNGTGPRHVAHHRSKNIVYFSNEQRPGVSVYSRDESGQLSLLQICDVQVGGEQLTSGSSSGLNIHPKGTLLFSGVRDSKGGNSGIARYMIRSDGTVKFHGLTSTGPVPWAVEVSADGKYLLTSPTSEGKILAYKIAPNGEMELSSEIKCPPRITHMVIKMSEKLETP